MKSKKKLGTNLKKDNVSIRNFWDDCHTKRFIVRAIIRQKKTKFKWIRNKLKTFIIGSSNQQCHRNEIIGAFEIWIEPQHDPFTEQKEKKNPIWWLEILSYNCPVSRHSKCYRYLTLSASHVQSVPSVWSGVRSVLATMWHTFSQHFVHSWKPNRPNEVNFSFNLCAVVWLLLVFLFYHWNKNKLQNDYNNLSEILSPIKKKLWKRQF